jgi:hypothetical protein
VRWVEVFRREVTVIASRYPTAKKNPANNPETAPKPSNGPRLKPGKNSIPLNARITFHQSREVKLYVAASLTSRWEAKFDLTWF